MDFVVAAVNLGPEDTGALYFTYSDLVQLARTCPSVVAAINWVKAATFAVDDMAPRRTRPTTFPLEAPRVPTRMPMTKMDALVRIAGLDRSTAEAFAVVATAYAATTLGDRAKGHLDDAPISTSGFVAVACGEEHCVGLRDDGTLIPWGSNRSGQRTDAPTSAGFVAVACGYNHSVGLRGDGTVVTWGLDSDAQRDGAPTGTGFVAIACGENHSVALRNDGTVVTWGESFFSQRTDAPTSAGFVAIACGEYHTVALRGDGTVVTWGRTASALATDVDAPTSAGFVAIACGKFHSVALRDDGTVVTWGRNNQGQCGGGPTCAGYVAIACGWHNSVALRDDGTVATWGGDPSLRLIGDAAPAPLRDVVAIAGGASHGVAAHDDGIVYSWGNIQYELPLPLGEKRSVVASKGLNLLVVVLHKEESRGLRTMDLPLRALFGASLSRFRR